MILVASTDKSLSNRDHAMLARAVEIAKQSTCKQKHGAIIYKSGRVLAVGINATRNEHPSMEISRRDYTYHAECAAIRGVGNTNRSANENATIYVARINRQGKPVNSFPCISCQTWAALAGIKRVVFTA